MQMTITTKGNIPRYIAPITTRNNPYYSTIVRIMPILCSQNSAQNSLLKTLATIALKFTSLASNTDFNYENKGTMQSEVLFYS